MVCKKDKKIKLKQKLFKAVGKIKKYKILFIIHFIKLFFFYSFIFYSNLIIILFCLFKSNIEYCIIVIKYLFGF